MDKSELRARLKALRAEAAARDPDAAETLAGSFPLKLLDRFGPVVAGYVAIGDEMDPAPLMRRLAATGAELCLPRVGADGRLSFHAWTLGEPLIDGPFGLKEPPAEAPEATPTLLLVPLLGFDSKGGRVGYGKGHYDRALARLRTEGRAFACGLAFKAQQVDDALSEDHDEPLDWAMTEAGSVPLFMIRAMPAR